MSALAKRTTREENFAFLGKVLEAGWIKDFSLAIDGGANVGKWTLRIAEKFKRVIAIEASPDIFTQLRENCRHVRHIECVNGAILDRVTTVEIVCPPGKKAKRSLYVQRAKRGTVQAAPLDCLGLSHGGFIKLDVEGAEYLALKGAAHTIAKLRPVLMIEMSQYGRRFGNSREQTEALLSSMGYVQVDACQPDVVYIPVEQIP